MALSSLREAIIAANNTTPARRPSASTSPAPARTPSTSRRRCPTITDAVILDASTDDSFAANGSRPAIILDGNDVTASGLTLTGTADGSTIRGLVIRDFDGMGISIQAGSSGNTVAGNYIGSFGADGNDAGASEANTGIGIRILGDNNIVGGTSAADRNVVGGNLGNGIQLGNSSATGNQILNNYVGVNAAGSSALGNGGIGVMVQSGASFNAVGAVGYGNLVSGNAQQGIRITGTTSTGNTVVANTVGLDSSGLLALGNAQEGIYISNGANATTVGGTAAGSGNIISGNLGDGVELTGSSTDPNVSTSANVIVGNTIGTDVSGTVALGNSGSGVLLSGGAFDNRIGGTTTDAANRIANNLFNAVQIWSGTPPGTGNAILGNLTWANGSIAIDLGGDGVTANDSGDADTGANNLQNFPVLATARTNASNQLILTGTLNSTANSYYRIEFFANATADASGNGEGQTYLGFANVATDGSGNATISTTLSVNVASGQFISATATRSDSGYTTFADTSEFAANVTATIAPLVTTSGTTLAYTENGAATAVDSALTVSDADSTNLTGATASISANFASGQDVLAFTDQNGITGSWNAGTGVLTLTGTTTVANYQAALRSITYVNASDAPGAATRTVSFAVNDGTGDSNAATRDISVTAVNDAPVLATGSTLAYTENQAATAINTAITVADVDSTTLASATVQITGNYASGEDVLAFTNVGMGNIAGVWDSGAGTLTLTSAGSTATMADWQAALRAVTYANSSDNPSMAARTVSYTVHDGALPSNTVTSTVNVAAVNEVPTLSDLDGDALAYAEGDGAVVIEQGGNAIVADVDSADFSGGGLTVSFAAGSDSAEDVLAVNNQGTGAGQISVLGGDVRFGGVTIATWGGGSGGTDLVITFNASATPAAAQALVRNITYENTDTTAPTTGARTVRYVLTDGDGGTSANHEATVTVSGVNDGPVNTVPVSLNVSEGIATALTGISIADVDAASAPMLVTLSVPTGSIAATTGGGVTVGGTASARTLTGTISDINAFIAANNVTYTTAANANGSVVLTVQTSDQGHTGSGGTQIDSDTVTLNITAVNDAPVNTVPGSVSVTEDVATALTGISIADVDAGGAAMLVTLTVPTGTLAAASGSGVTVGGTSSALTLAGSIADINAFIAASGVTYTTLADANGTVTLTVLTSDQGNTGAGGTLTDSDAVALNITAVNDAPTLGNGTLAAVSEDSVSPAGQTVATIFAGQFGDVDAGSSFGGMAVVANTANAGTQGAWQYSSNGGTNWFAVGAVTDGASALAISSTSLIRFVPVADYNGTPPALTVRGLDNTYAGSFSTTSGSETRVTTNTTTNGGTTAIAVATATLSTSITAANDVPVVTTTGTTLAYTENGAATAVDSALTVSDTDSTNLTGATVSISANFASGQDVLAFTNQLGITGSWNAGTGVLTLSGTTTLANYQAALRSITYMNTSDAPGSSTRTVSFVVNDGTANSTAATRNISVAAVNDAPDGANNTLTLNEDAVYTFTSADFGFSDVDDHALQQVWIDTLPSAGELRWNGATFAAGNWIDVADIDAGLFTYTPAADGFGTGYASFQFRVQDDGGTANGGADTDPLANTITFDVTAVNDPPVLGISGGTLAYTENGAATAIDNGLTVSDADSTNLTGATVSISANFASGQDVLAFTNQLGITGSWNAGTGVLTLSGTTTVANYQAALRSITYVNTSDAPSTATRTVSFVVNDGTANSTAATRNISVAAVNDAATGSVTIDGTTPMQGQTLTASNTLADLDGLGVISYQWQRGGVDIVGATGATYVTSQADVGSVLRVVASYTDGQGTPESVAAANSAAVASMNDAPVLVPPTLPIEPVPAPAPSPALAEPPAAPPVPASTSVSKLPSLATSALEVVTEQPPSSAVESPRTAVTNLVATVFADDPVARAAPRSDAAARNQASTDPVLASASFDLDALDVTPADVPMWQLDVGKTPETLASRGPMQLRRGDSVEAESSPILALEESTQGTGGLEIALSSPVGVSGVGVTAGFVWWLTRAGGLLTTVLMGVPAWRHVDLLPVLASADDDDEEGAEDADTTFKDSDIDADDDLAVADLFDHRAAPTRAAPGQP